MLRWSLLLAPLMNARASDCHLQSSRCWKILLSRFSTSNSSSIATGTPGQTWLPSSGVCRLNLYCSRHPVTSDRQLLKSISSLLELHKDSDHPVRPFHKLLFDCLTNPERCKDKRFLINTSGKPSGKTFWSIVSCYLDRLCRGM